MATFLAANDLGHPGVLVAGFAFLLVGLGFKVAAAPFHMWTPDVYQGAPTPVTAFMASATKVAAFAAFLRIFVGTFPLYGVDWRPAVWGLAVLSLVVGTVAALVQTNPAYTTQAKYTGIRSKFVFESSFSIMDGQTNYKYQPGTPPDAMSARTR